MSSVFWFATACLLRTVFGVITWDDLTSSYTIEAEFGEDVKISKLLQKELDFSRSFPRENFQAARVFQVCGEPDAQNAWFLRVERNSTLLGEVQLIPETGTQAFSNNLKTVPPSITYFSGTPLNCNENIFGVYSNSAETLSVMAYSKESMKLNSSVMLIQGETPCPSGLLCVKCIETAGTIIQISGKVGSIPEQFKAEFKDGSQININIRGKPSLITWNDLTQTGYQYTIEAPFGTTVHIAHLFQKQLDIEFSSPSEYFKEAKMYHVCGKPENASFMIFKNKTGPFNELQFVSTESEAKFSTGQKTVPATLAFTPETSLDCNDNVVGIPYLPPMTVGISAFSETSALLHQPLFTHDANCPSGRLCIREASSLGAIIEISGKIGILPEYFEAVFMDGSYAVINIRQKLTKKSTEGSTCTENFTTDDLNCQCGSVITWNDLTESGNSYSIEAPIGQNVHITHLFQKRLNFLETFPTKYFQEAAMYSACGNLEGSKIWFMTFFGDSYPFTELQLLPEGSEFMFSMNQKTVPQAIRYKPGVPLDCSKNVFGIPYVDPTHLNLTAFSKESELLPWSFYLIHGSSICPSSGFCVKEIPQFGSIVAISGKIGTLPEHFKAGFVDGTQVDIYLRRKSCHSH